MEVLLCIREAGCLPADGMHTDFAVSVFFHNCMARKSRSKGTCDEAQSLNAIEVCMLDGHDVGIRKQLLRVVVDELAVNEAVDAMPDDLLNLALHLVLLRLLYVGHLRKTMCQLNYKIMGVRSELICAVHLSCQKTPNLNRWLGRDDAWRAGLSTLWNLAPKKPLWINVKCA